VFILAGFNVIERSFGLGVHPCIASASPQSQIGLLSSSEKTGVVAKLLFATVCFFSLKRVERSNDSATVPNRLIGGFRLGAESSLSMYSAHGP